MAIANRLTEDADAPFTLAALVTEAGSAGNGEKLVNTLMRAYPAALQAATLKRVNQRLTDQLDQDAISGVAKVAGAPADSDLNVKVRGGETRESDAVITYAFHDAEGQLWKGCFPYTELGKTDPRDHVSQRESLAGSPAAEDHAKALAKARAAAGRSEETRGLQARIAELEAQVEAQGDDPEPAEYDGKDAREIAADLADAPRETVQRVLVFEQAHKDRSTITTAAQKRLDALDQADAAKDAELETLRSRVAELEGTGQNG
jgi:hypothetical protein